MCLRCNELDVRDAGAKGPRPFALPGYEPKYARDRVAQVKHIRLDVALDFERKRIEGTATTTFSALNDGLQTIVFDAVELEIQGVKDGSGKALAFEHDGERLSMTLARTLRSGEETSIAITYAGSPRRGLYFV